MEDSRKTFTSVTLITPTRDRPECLALCEFWVSRFQWTGDVQWIIVDDGDVPAETRRGQEIIRREPSGDEHTLAKNLLAAAELVRGDAVMVIEDDDWYSPNYVNDMVRKLRYYELCGEARARYYHVPTRGYLTCYNRLHASLSATAFRRNLIKRFRAACRAAIADGNPYVDLYFWGRRPPLPRPDPRGYIFFKQHLNLGLKGMPGRRGIARGHEADVYERFDLDGKQLEDWVGYSDAARILSFFPDPVIVPPRPMNACPAQVPLTLSAGSTLDSGRLLLEEELPRVPADGPVTTEKTMELGP